MQTPRPRWRPQFRCLIVPSPAAMVAATTINEMTTRLPVDSDEKATKKRSSPEGFAPAGNFMTAQVRMTSR
jgi:hypothetical protein